MSAQASIINTSSPMPVQGGAADNTPISGFPIQIGGEYRAADPTYTDGNIGYLRIDQNGRLLVNGLPQSVGQKTMANSMPVVVASDQSAIPIKLDDGSGASITVGQKAKIGSLPVALASDQDPLPVKLEDGAGSAVNKGQAAMAGSLPVALASDQSALPIKLEDGAGSAVNKGQAAMAGSLPVALASDQSAIPTKLQDGSGSAVNKGQALRAASLPVVWATEQEAQIGALTETAPLSDTASSGLNGRLQRLAQNISSLIALLPASIGQKISTGSLSVVVASDQPSIGTKPDANVNGTQATGTATGTAVTLTAPANAVGFILQAAGSNTTALRWRIGATATTTVGQRLEPGADSGYVPCGGNVSVIPETATASEYEIQWVQR